MRRIEGILTQVEARLRQLIEGEAGGDGFPRQLQRLVERELIKSMKRGARKLSNEQTQSEQLMAAPDQYTVILPPMEAQILLIHPARLDWLAQKLQTSAKQSGLAFGAAPMLRVVADPQCKLINVMANFAQTGVAESSTYPLEGMPDTNAGLSEALPSAFLIVNGLSTFPLKLPVINIGRDPSNQLRLNDPHIARQHAQLRLVQGRFIIFDLDSPTGTFVNGVAVTSHALDPGDVIRLADLPLVYGQEASCQGGQTQKLPSSPLPPEVL